MTAANAPRPEDVEPTPTASNDGAAAPPPASTEPTERPRRKLPLHYGAPHGEKP